MVDFSDEYTIIKSNKRKNTIKFVIENNQIIIYTPITINETIINNIYSKHRDKLLLKFKKIDHVNLLGKEFKIEKKPSKLLKKPYFEIKNNILIQNLPMEISIEKINESFKDWQYKILYKIIYNKIKFFSLKYYFNFDFKKNFVRIKSQNTLWGSCSFNNNLNFNYKLIEKNNEVINYVVLHELTHTIYKNHSKYFWNELEKILPNCRKYIKILKINS